ncbi:MAG: acyl--CoA ligase [Bacilli bacterium]|nr:acyl--CoA ligase [Bacilli bacterium]
MDNFKISSIEIYREIPENSKLDKESSQKITGLASIDMPWMKYYNHIPSDAISTDTNMFDYFVEVTKKIGNIPLLEYCGKTYTRVEIIEEVEKYITKFVSIGVKKGEIISFLMLDVPEVLFSILALSKIGAVANLIKFDQSPEQIKNIINSTNSKYIFVTEIPLILDNVIKSLKDNNKVKIISVPLFASLSKKELYLMFKDKIKNNNIIKTIEELTENQKNIAKIKNAKPVIPFNSWIKLKKDKPINYENGTGKDTTVIVYTGGTTGETKGVVLTNKNITSSAKGFIYGEYDFNLGKSAMNILPPSIAYYLNATYCLMCCGVKVNLIPAFTLEEYPLLIKKHKPNIFLAGPILFKEMRNSQELTDTSYVTAAISGGDKLAIEEEKAMTDFLRRTGSDSITHQGYGESECTAAATYTKTNSYKLGSIGIPFINVKVSIFDSDTLEELPYGCDNIGEICISGDTVMQGYYNKIDATREVLKIHQDGSLWLHTKDYGFMDQDGLVYHCGRDKRMITRNGSKIWLNSIEEIIFKHKNVFNCCCVKNNDSDEREVPVCYLVLKENTDITKTIKEIAEMIKQNLPTENIPKYFVLTDSIPYTEVNKKVDFRALEKNDIHDSKDYIITGNIVKKRVKTRN